MNVKRNADKMHSTIESFKKLWSKINIGHVACPDVQIADVKLYMCDVLVEECDLDLSEKEKFILAYISLKPAMIGDIKWYLEYRYVDGYRLDFDEHVKAINTIHEEAEKIVAKLIEKNLIIKKDERYEII